MIRPLPTVPRIYGISKLTHRQLWHDLRLRRLTVDWVARWPTLPDDYPEERLFPDVIWPDCQRANVGLVYLPNPTVHLKGALLEMGYLSARSCPLVLWTTASRAEVRLILGDFAHCRSLHYASTEAAALHMCHQLVQPA